MSNLAHRLRRVSGSVAADVSFVSRNEDSSDLTTYDFGTLSFGAESGRSAIIAIVVNRDGGGSERTISSITFGGASGTVRAHATQDGTSCDIVTAEPTGVSGNVSVTFSGGTSRAAVALYRAEGLDSLVPTDTYTAGGDAQTSMGSSLAISEGGFAVAGVMVSQSGTTFTWTNMTEDVDDVAIEGTNMLYSAAHRVSPSSETPSMTVAMPASNNAAFSLAAFR